MSFILDALKKSESDRQRQSGPALFEVKIAPPRSRFPLWAVAIAVLLGVNVAIGAWLLLRRPAHPEEAPAPAPVATTSQPAAGGPASAAAVSPAQGPAAGSPPLIHAVGSPVQVPVPAASPPGAAGASGAPVYVTPLGSSSQVPGVPGPNASAPNGGVRGEPTLAGGGRQSPGASNMPANGPSGSVNPDDYAPATEPAATPGLSGHVRRGTASGYILYQDASVVPGANIPPLRLDLHVYAPQPQDRFALINMHRVREGESLPEGVHVESITPDGVVLSFNGMKFLLPRE